MELELKSLIQMEKNYKSPSLTVEMGEERRWPPQERENYSRLRLRRGSCSSQSTSSPLTLQHCQSHKRYLPTAFLPFVTTEHEVLGTLTPSPRPERFWEFMIHGCKKPEHEQLRFNLRIFPISRPQPALPFLLPPACRRSTVLPHLWKA